MKTFRTMLLWAHLFAGLAAGFFIALMSFTGLVLAFEEELVAWSEQDARRVEPGLDESLRFTPEEMLTTFQNRYPDAPLTHLTVSADPRDAYVIAIGRDATYYADPYAGEFREPRSEAMHHFMQTMESWHRWLGREGEGRALGKAINGAANLVFVFLAVSGLYLWWPAAWRWKVLRRSLVFVRSRGKARDWNWHTTIGFWCLLPILVMAVTGTVISYRWAGNLVYQAVGEEPPPPRSRGGTPSTAINQKWIRPPSPEANLLSLDELLLSFDKVAPGWETLRVNLPFTETAPDRGATPVTVTAMLPDRWPRTASTTFEVDPYTSEPLKKTSFEDSSTGRQARHWMRFLHTGQALGWIGQLIAAIGCLGGLFLVYTGFALSWRRFFRKERSNPH
jgi:uncharacterized iron-regulated membrane protein